MMLYFYKTGELNGSNYVKIPSRSNAYLNIENNDNYCFLWSILASLHPCDKNHPYRVSSFIQYFDKLNIENFDFTNGFKCSDVLKFSELNSLFINIFELNFYQDQNKGENKLMPIEVSKNESDSVIDITI